MLVNFSGGLDSATLVAQEIENGTRPALVFWNYGQGNLHDEREAARNLATRWGLHLFERDLFALARTDEVVWGARNGLMAMAAASFALTIGQNRIAFGCNASDWERFPDCRPDFWRAMNEALAAYGVSCALPFLRISKAQVAAEARRLNVPVYETFSCYSPRRGMHCGECLACQTREAALND